MALGQTQLVITHDMSLALELCPRAVIMNQGSVVAGGATRELLGDQRLLEENRLELPFGLTVTDGSTDG